nr:hypothetical protein [Tanacetum cinerariifolium]
MAFTSALPRDGGFNLHPSSIGGRDVWCDIIKSISYIESIDPGFNDSFILKVGNGKKTSFWLDPWCGNGVCLKDLFPRLYALDTSQECKVCDRWSVSDGVWGGTWSWRFPHRGRALDALDDIVLLISNLSLSDIKDKWSWSRDASRSFKVKDCCNIIQENALADRCLGLHHFWNSWIPHKVNICVWRASINRLASRTNPAMRGIDIPSTLCPLCESDEESIEHCLIFCSRVLPIWRKVWSWWQLDPPSSFPLFSITDIALGRVRNRECHDFTLDEISHTFYSLRSSRNNDNHESKDEFGGSQADYSPAKDTNNKRKWEDDHKGSSSQQRNKKPKAIRAHTVGPSNKKGYAGKIPLCNKCMFHHTGPCAAKCGNCKRVLKAKQSPSVAKQKAKVTYYECGILGHFKSDCPKWKFQKRVNEYHKEKALRGSSVVANNISITSSTIETKNLELVNEIKDKVKRLDDEKNVFENKISKLEKDLTQRVKDFDDVKTELSRRTDKFETYFANLEKENALLKSQLASQNYTSLQKENNDLRTSYNVLKEEYEISCAKLEKENNDLKMHYKRLFDSIKQKKVASQVFTKSILKVNVSDKIYTGESSKPISKKVSQFNTSYFQKDRNYLKKQHSFETFVFQNHVKNESSKQMWKSKENIFKRFKYSRDEIFSMRKRDDSILKKVKDVRTGIDLPRSLPSNLRELDVENANNKRKWGSNHDESLSQQNKGHKVPRAHTAWPINKKAYNGSLPLCNQCKLHHSRPCTVKCGNYKKVGHVIQNYRTPATAKNPGTRTCYECGSLRHYKSECPIVKFHKHVDMIHGRMRASKPKTMQDAIEIETKLRNKKISTLVECQTKNKKRLDNTPKNNQNQQQPNKRQNTERAYTARQGEKKHYSGAKLVFKLQKEKNDELLQNKVFKHKEEVDINNTIRIVPK